MKKGLIYGLCCLAAITTMCAVNERAAYWWERSALTPVKRRDTWTIDATVLIDLLKTDLRLKGTNIPPGRLVFYALQPTNHGGNPVIFDAVQIVVLSTNQVEVYENSEGEKVIQ